MEGTMPAKSTEKGKLMQVVVFTDNSQRSRLIPKPKGSFVSHCTAVFADIARTGYTHVDEHGYLEWFPPHVVASVKIQIPEEE